MGQELGETERGPSDNDAGLNPSEGERWKEF